ncbi:hypothetical protein PLANPX_0295 [Lacipirellula parvula]|uniref:Uncharacterized protein n=1 Tax=Lacipirellula parvula TaxID=2650471 RepID=A0A5K7X8C3_9BACT|nr:hypothetical protein PLANPX_0295 [Lacipirellula parvula]
MKQIAEENALDAEPAQARAKEEIVPRGSRIGLPADSARPCVGRIERSD